MPRKVRIAMPDWTEDPIYRQLELNVIDHGADDLPRLALADRLEEIGHPSALARAEFIRVQIESNHLDAGDARRETLLARANQLLTQHESSWLGGMDRWLSQVSWERGFPEKVKIGVRQFVERWPVLQHHLPSRHIHLLRLSQTSLPMEQLANTPGFSELRGFSIPRSLAGDSKVAELLHISAFSQLECLDLSESGLGHRSLAILPLAKLPRLQSLTLAGNNLHQILASLCRKDVPFRLKTLNLTHTYLGLIDYESLFQWPGLEHVQHLNLWGNRLGNPGAFELARSPRLANLRSLNLGVCQIGTRGITAIQSSGGMPLLEDLDLHGNDIRPSGLSALLGCLFAHRLTALKLGNNQLEDRGAHLLQQWPGLSRVSTLNLSSNGLTSQGIGALCRSPYLRQVTQLNLSDNAIGDRGVHHLATCAGLQHLRKLDLTLCRLSDLSVRSLFQSPFFPNLRELRLGGNALSNPTSRVVLRHFPRALRMW